MRHAPGPEPTSVGARAMAAVGLKLPCSELRHGQFRSASPLLGCGSNDGDFPRSTNMSGHRLACAYRHKLPRRRHADADYTWSLVWPRSASPRGRVVHGSTRHRGARVFSVGAACVLGTSHR
ncbi:hypothetical protein HYQ44_019874 [Verticillium longisporum]|nr:hypothetical protein HYQ44_019874 [Verticillium longisporum]